MSDKVGEAMETEEGMGENTEQNPQDGVDNRELKFPCPFCPMRFSTIQGLNGHQNAHKQGPPGTNPPPAAAILQHPYNHPLTAIQLHYPSPYYQYMNYRPIAPAVRGHPWPRGVPQACYLPRPPANFVFNGLSPYGMSRPLHLSTYVPAVATVLRANAGRNAEAASSSSRSCVPFGKKIVTNDEEAGTAKEKDMVLQQNCRDLIRKLKNPDEDDGGNDERGGIDLTLRL